VLPVAEAPGFERRAVSTYISPPYLTQATIAEFVARGRFEPNLESVCGELRARRDAMLGALERTFPEDASWSRPEGGYFVWLELDDEQDASELARRAEAQGVAFVRGSDFFPPGSEQGASAARLAFSFEPPERIVEGVELLAGLLG
jgi:2-aminoadipate transaminase